MKRMINIPMTLARDDDPKVLAASISYLDSETLELNMVVVAKVRAQTDCTMLPVACNYKGTLDELASRVLEEYTQGGCTELVIDLSGLGASLADKIIQLNKTTRKNKHCIASLLGRNKSTKQNELLEITGMRPTESIRFRALLLLLEAYQSDNVAYVGADFREFDTNTEKEIAWLFGLAYGRAIGYDFT